jgi:hypothetical protein
MMKTNPTTPWIDEVDDDERFPHGVVQLPGTDHDTENNKATDDDTANNEATDHDTANNGAQWHRVPAHHHQSHRTHNVHQHQRKQAHNNNSRKENQIEMIRRLNSAVHGVLNGTDSVLNQNCEYEVDLKLNHIEQIVQSLVVNYEYRNQFDKIVIFISVFITFCFICVSKIFISAGYCMPLGK